MTPPPIAVSPGKRNKSGRHTKEVWKRTPGGLNPCSEPWNVVDRMSNQSRRVRLRLLVGAGALAPSI